jgi:hypothetical protein
MARSTAHTALRWIAIACTAVPLGATVAHVFELPNKMTLDGPLWLAVQQNLYRGWGPLIAPFEITAIVAAWTLVFLERERQRTFPLTFLAALCLTAMLGVFFLLNAPVNSAFAQWTATTLPPDWPSYRLRWEVGHALGCLLALVAFGALLRAAFVASLDAARAAARPPGPARRHNVIALRATK